ncbi:MAG: energy transducer TonB [Bacteroidota bacterium]
MRRLTLIIGLFFPVGLIGQIIETDTIQPPLVEIIDFKEEMPRFFNPVCEQLTNENDRKACADSTLLDFVYSRLEYPPVSHEVYNCLVVVNFMIDRTGKVKNPKVLRDCPPFGKNALEVIGEMPDWIPGKQWGRNVDVQYNFPIRYRSDH